MLQAFLQGAFELIFPDNCLLCRRFLNSRHQRQICTDCQAKLLFNPQPYRLQTVPSPFAFDHAWSACIYNETAQHLLHAFKYNSKTALKNTISNLMIEFIDRHYIPVQKFDLITPVPLHPVKCRERGYNQSALIGLKLSQHYEVPYVEDLLVRSRNTHTQTDLGAKQRWTNMEGAFRIKNSAQANDKIILLIDDLYTTGATLHHAAEALKSAGAARVGALTFGITI